MRFALVDNERRSPSPGLTGHCPGCGAAVIAKCGTERVHHWSHRSKRICDPWWETETLWHRNWKDRFPQPWQEVIQHDASGEKHIADVRTDRGLVLEFQHSHLNPLEKASREKFHQNMVWVVDGLRLVRDLPRLIEGRRLLRKVGQGVYITASPRDVLPHGWLECRAPVFFDFRGDPDPDDQSRNMRQSLWCLLPGRAHHHAVILKISPDDFVRLALERPQVLPVKAMLQEIAQALMHAEARAAEQARRAEIMRMQALVRPMRSYRSRRPPRFPGRGRRF